MEIPLYQIDAFTDRIFGGNPAALCPLDAWLDDALLQSIAAENNLSETAFLVPQDDGYHLRWFTPAVEVDLCGHATLAAGWLIFNRLQPSRDAVTFYTRSGPLTVTRDGTRLSMDFPARPALPVAPCAGLIEAMGAKPREILAARDYLLVYDNAAAVRALKPDMAALLGIDRFAVIATAPGEAGYDCVSRFFAPAQGVPEDPVTGSAHCTIVPYWAAKLGRKRIKAFQASSRGGTLFCQDRGERVALAGDCAFYMQGTIYI